VWILLELQFVDMDKHVMGVYICTGTGYEKNVFSRLNSVTQLSIDEDKVEGAGAAAERVCVSV
jgi:hypothetical protein